MTQLWGCRGGGCSRPERGQRHHVHLVSFWTSAGQRYDKAKKVQLATSQLRRCMSMPVEMALSLKVSVQIPLSDWRHH